MSPDPIQEAVVAEREACAKAVCNVCRDAGPPVFIRPEGQTERSIPVHRIRYEIGRAHATVFCAAAAIWCRGLEE